MLRVSIRYPQCGPLLNPFTWVRGYATVTTRGKKDEERKKEDRKPPLVTKNKWGLFGDIHFDDRTLGRVVTTSEWILKIFREQGVSQIICMGDVLNTREVVSVQSLSAATKFFDELSLIAPVNVILGNHDMNLKHSGKLSSLDVLDMRELRQRITLHRAISTVEIDSVPCVMVPYQEDSREILNWIAANKEGGSLKKRVAFAHLALEGAIQRYQKDNKSVHTKSFHLDPLPLPSGKREKSEKTRTTTHLTPNSMLAFKRVFSGHFHHHHSPSSNFIYVGAPMQHTYGDAGDSSRGVVIYEPSSDSIQFVQNPEWDTFRIIRVTSEEDLAQTQKQAVSRELAGKYVNMLYTGEMSMNARKVDSIHDALLKYGAKEARKALATSFLSKQKSISAPAVVHHSPEAVVPAYVAMAAETRKNVDDSWREEATRLGQSIVSDVTKREKGAKLQWAGETFVARLVSITMENFLGVRETLMVYPADMRDGVWFLTGPNGSGKSTLLEAVTWCLFDRFLRSDMKSDFAVNDTVKKNCTVRVAFDNGYEVERFRKHKEKGNGIKIYKDGKYLSELERGNTRDSQRVLEGLLGISFETFTKAVVLGDNAAMNFLMSDSKRRRETIEELLEMDIFDLFLAEVRERRKAITLRADQESLREESITRDIQIRKADIEREELVRQQHVEHLQQLTNEVCYNSERIAEWESENKALKQLEKTWSTVRHQQYIRDKWLLYQSNHRAYELASSALEQNRNQLETLHHTLNQTVNLCNQESLVREKSNTLADLQGPQTTELQAEVARKEQHVVELDNQLTSMAELIKQGRCPTCQQAVTNHRMHKPEQNLTNNRSSAVAELNAAKAQLKELEAESSRVTSTLGKLLGGKSFQDFLAQVGQREQIEEKHRILQVQVQEQEEALAATPDPAQVLNDLKMPKEQIQSIATSQESSISEVNDPSEALANHHGNQAGLLEEKFRLQSEVVRLTLAVADSQKRHNEQAEQVMVMEEDLFSSRGSQDTSETQLSLLEFWEKGFDKRTLKSAEFPTMRSYMLAQSVQDLNAILAQYSHIVGSGEHLGISFNADLELNEDFGKRSAGQRKRNDIVIMLSLFELIRQRGRFRADFVMLDEVFDALDVNGKLAVQELLVMLAERVSKVFVITHSQPHLMSKDANVIQVSMTPQGTAMDIVGLTMY